MAERTTIGALVETLRSRHAALGSRAFAVARNQALARASDPLADGDEVALLPPVSGG